MAVKQDVKLLNEQVIHYTVEKPLQALIAKKRFGSRINIDYFLAALLVAVFSRQSAGWFAASWVWIFHSRAGLPISATCGNTGSASIYIMLNELFRSESFAAQVSACCVMCRRAGVFPPRLCI
jgi:3-oxoacyl-[acyl-carrier-protein] synthase-3